MERSLFLVTNGHSVCMLSAIMIQRTCGMAFYIVLSKATMEYNNSGGMEHTFGCSDCLLEDKLF